ncbi:hypothetical protein [Priestia aryabhattai]
MKVEEKKNGNLLSIEEWIHSYLEYHCEGQNKYSLGETTFSVKDENSEGEEWIRLYREYQEN